MTTDPIARAKAAAARRGAELVESGMTLGLGTGSTAEIFLQELARRIREEGLDVRGVPTSEAAARIAARLEIPLVPLAPSTMPDLVVDGADEVDLDGSLTKGGGGALVREKIVAAAGLEMVVLVHWGKVRERLGAFPLPVAVIPFGWEAVADWIGALYDDVAVQIRKDGRGEAYRTDDGLHVLDCSFGEILDPHDLEEDLEGIPGVVACGLFCDLADRIIVGRQDGGVEELPLPG